MQPTCRYSVDRDAPAQCLTFDHRPRVAAATLPAIKQMKEKIELILQDLIGLQLTRTTRAANMECLKFGEQQVVSINGELWEVGEFGIHLQCSWRFVDKEKILIGSQDVYEPEDENAEYDEDFDWEAGNLRDKKLRGLITTEKLVIETVIADNYGGAEIGFSNRVKLQIFPDYSKMDNCSEYWRLLDNRISSKKHVIISGAGVQ